MKPAFTCPVCQKIFESLSDLMKHAKMSHTEQDILKSNNNSTTNARAVLA